MVFLFCCTSLTAGESVDFGELVRRNETYFKKFSDVPFSGTVTGRAEGQLLNGMPDGIFRRFHANGQLAYKYEEPHDRQTEVRQYNQSGIVQWIKRTKNGRLHGVNSTFFENGMLREKTTYKNGVLHGIAEHYDANGELKSRGVWLDGKPSGEQRFYDAGSLIEQVNGEVGTTTELQYDE